MGVPTIHVLSLNIPPQVRTTDSEIINPDYDVYIWDLEAGEHFSNLYNTVQEVSAGFRSLGLSLFHHRPLDNRALSSPESRWLPSLNAFEVETPSLVQPSDLLIDTHQSAPLLYHAGLVQSCRIRAQDHHSGPRDSTSSRYQARRTA